MDKFLLLLAFLLPLVMVEVEVEGDNVKLFVFGDSSVDTGNCAKDVRSWKPPYGMTYPGKPVGRFSDGSVLIDYIANFFGIPSPVPYEQRIQGYELIPYGMNFAFGGTGVFDTLVQRPNMTTQISYFEQLLKDQVYNKNDLESSVALVCLEGNDYDTYINHTLVNLDGNSSATSVKDSKIIQSLPDFTTKLINQLALDLKRIHDLGVRKIGVLALQPLGCSPQVTAPLFQFCYESINTVATFHNLLLVKAVQKLRETGGSNIVVLDLYTAFISALKLRGYPLRPCCMGVGYGVLCGTVDSGGKKMYTVCKDPKSAFFWDEAHPTHHGWSAIYSAFRDSLHQLY